MAKNRKLGGETLVFIDSNIYLRFYDSNQPNFKKLLKTLTELKDRIFVTNQIVNEVIRNKGQVFEQTFLNYIKQISDNYNTIQLPEHLDIEEDGKIKEWNKRIKALGTEGKALIKDLKAIFSETYMNIYSSNDEVSKDLNKIFLNKIAETDIQYNNALKRKTTGNPPGKNNDSLGDQLNWEQLIGVIGNVDNLYIISNDYDYFTKINEELYLNSLLIEELKSFRPNISIKCYNTLSSALQSLNKNNDKPLPIPKGAIFEEIITEELENEVNYEDIDSYPGFIVYQNPNHKILDTISRLNYLYRHVMISTFEFINRLEKLGLESEDAEKIAERGRINTSDYVLFRDYISYA